jgi:hypothetical protein
LTTEPRQSPAEPFAGDAVARYRAASEAADLDTLLETLAPDAELVSPISGRMVFRGKHDLGILLEAVYTSMSGLRWDRQIGDGDTRVVLGSASVGPVEITDAMVFDLAGDGRIRRIRPHLRPWLALTLLAIRLIAKLAAHPAVIARALRRR